MWFEHTNSRVAVCLLKPLGYRFAERRMYEKHRNISLSYSALNLGGSYCPAHYELFVCRKDLSIDPNFHYFCTNRKEIYKPNPNGYWTSCCTLLTQVILFNDIQYLYLLFAGGIMYFAGFLLCNSPIIALYVPLHAFITMLVPLLYTICNFSTHFLLWHLHYST